jgi:predicted nucleotidyltransferase
MNRLNLSSTVAVLLFGSLARGDQTDHSDLDVLVVVRDQAARTEVLRDVRSHLDSLPTPLVLTVESLEEEAAKRPSFVAHLLDEGIVLYDAPGWTALRNSLARAAVDQEALTNEIRNRARSLWPLQHTERFRNSPVTALSHVYGIARSLVIVDSFLKESTSIAGSARLRSLPTFAPTFA